MKMTRAFTLIEMIIVLAIISSLLAFSINGLLRFSSSIEYNSAVDQVFSDVQLAQQMAQASHEICKIEFRAGKNEYKVLKSNIKIKDESVTKKVQFYGKSYFSFVPSGFTEVGGSGTLFLGGSPKIKKIIVSSKGRIRIE